MSCLYLRLCIFTLAALLAPCCLYGTDSGISPNRLLGIDTNASPEKQASIGEYIGDIPIINIAPPNESGISHNLFNDYHVGPQGVVYNNNATIDPVPGQPFLLSALTGTPLWRNENLCGRSACLILTEVTGCNRSVLEGITEIYGSAASYILVNPNGIYCNGAGFINTHSVTLSTGRPIFDRYGMLRSLQVRQGTIEVQGEGITAYSLDNLSTPIDLLSRVTKISGHLWTKGSVGIYTGVNDIDYQTKSLTKIQDVTSQTPHIAIDASLVGKISAGKIMLVATERGVGMNCPTLLTNADNIQISADGDIQLRGDLQSDQSIFIESKSGDILQENAANKLFAKAKLALESPKGKIHLMTDKRLTHHGAIALKAKHLHTGPSVYLSGCKEKGFEAKLDLNIAKNIHNEGIIKLPSLNHRFSDLYNSGTLQTEDRLALQVDSIFNQGMISNRTNNDVILDVRRDIKNKGKIGSHGILRLSGSVLNNNKGGIIFAEKGIEIRSHSEVINKGTIESSHGTVAICCKGDVSNEQTLFGQSNLTITAHNLTNEGQLRSEGKIDLTIDNQINNVEGVWSSGNLNLNLYKLTNGTPTLRATNAPSTNNFVSPNDMEQSSSRPEDTTDNQTATSKRGIISSTDISIKGRDFTNNGQGILSAQNVLVVRSANSILNHGILRSIDNAVAITSDDFVNEGTISSHQNLSIDANHQLLNHGILQADHGDILLHTKNALQTTHTIQSGGKLTITSNSFVNRGNISSVKRLLCRVDQKFDNMQNIFSKGDIFISSGPFDNHVSGSIEAEQYLVVNTINNITNLGKLIGKHKNVEVLTNRFLDNQSLIVSGCNLTLKSGQLTNGKDGSIYAQKNMDIKTPGGFYNQGMLSATEGSVQLEVGKTLLTRKTIQSKDCLHIEAETVINKKDILSQDDIVMRGDQIGNDTHGNIIANKSMQINSRDKIVNHGKLQTRSGPLILVAKNHLWTTNKISSGYSLSLQAQSCTNSGYISSEKDAHIELVGCLDNEKEIVSPKNMFISSEQVANSVDGTIAAQDILTIRATSTCYNAGLIASKNSDLSLTIHKELVTTGTIRSDQLLSLTIGDYLINRGTIHSASHLKLSAGQHVENTASILSKGRLAISSSTFLSGKSAVLSAQNQLYLKIQGTFMNKGLLESNQSNISIIASEDFTNQGKMCSGKRTIITSGALSNTKVIRAMDGLSLQIGNNLINQGSLESAHGAVYLQTGQSLVTSGIVSSGGVLMLDAHTFTNKGTITAGSTALFCVGDNFKNYKAIATTKGLLNIRILENGGIYNYKQGTIISQSGLFMDKAGKIFNYGVINNQQGLLSLYSLGVAINSKQIISSGPLVLTAAYLKNTKEISAIGNLGLKIIDTLDNQHNIISKKSLNITACNLINGQKSVVQCANQLHIHSQGAFSNDGSLVALSGGMVLHAGKDFSTTGQISSVKPLAIQASTFHNSGLIAGQQHVSLSIKEDVINKGTITGIGTLEITSGHFNNQNHGIVSGAGKFVMVAKGGLTNDGSLRGQQVDITATGAVITRKKIESNSDLFLKTHSLLNSGTIHTPQNLTMVSQEATINYGSVRSINDQATITADKLDNNVSGIIAAKGPLALTIKNDLTNSGFVKGKTLHLTVGTLLTNHDRIISKQDILIQTGSLDNSTNGLITTPNHLAVLAKYSLTNSGLLQSKRAKLQVEQSLTNQCKIVTAQNMTIQSGSLNNNGDIIVCNRTLSITTNDDFCNSGTIKSGENGCLRSDGYFTNSSTIQAYQALSIHGNSIHNSGSITTPSSLTINGTTFDNNRYGNMQSQGLFSIVIQRKINNKGTIISQNNLQCNAENLANDSKMAGSHVAIDVDQTFYNQGNITGKEGVKVKTKEGVNAGHIIGSAFSINAEQFDNTYAGILTGKGYSCSIEIADKLTNKGIIEANGMLNIHARELKNEQCIYGASQIHLSGNVLYNDSGKIITHGDITTQVGAHFVNNSGGEILAEGHITLHNGSYRDGAIEVFDNAHLIRGGRSIVIHADNFENSGQVIGTDGTISTTRLGSLGSLMASDRLRLTVKGSSDLTYRSGLVGRHIYLDLQGAFANHAILETRGTLHIKCNSLTNNKSLIAGEDLICESATTLFNNQAYLYTEAKMHIKAPKGIDNYQGTIRSGGNMILDGQEIKNHGKLLGDVVGKAQSCHAPTCYQTPQSGWVQVCSNGSGHEASWHNFTKVKRTKVVCNLAIEKPAIIYAGGDLSFPCHFGSVHNYGSSIAANGNINSNATIHNETPSKKIDLPEKSIYEKKWTVRRKKEVGFWESVGKFFITPVTVAADVMGSAVSVINPFSHDGVDFSVTRNLYNPDYTYEENSQRYRKPITYTGYASTAANIYARGQIICRKGIVNGPRSTQGGSYLSGRSPYISATPIQSNHRIIHHMAEPGTPFTSHSMSSDRLENATASTRPSYTNKFPDYLTDNHTNLQHLGPIDSLLHPPLFSSDSGLSKEEQEDRDIAPAFFSSSGGNVFPSPAALRIPSLSRSDYASQAQPSSFAYSGYGSQDVQPISFLNFTDPQGPGASFRLNFSAPNSSNRILSDNWKEEAVVKAIQPDPPKRSNYYINTPGAVIDHSNYYGSPYLIRKLGLENPSIKFLGDPFWEVNYVNEQIQKISGRRYLSNDIASDAEQLRLLMDHTANVYKDLNVALGVSLSPAQIRHLRRDIIWYETQEIQGQQVLAPVVYLCPDTIARLKNKPSLASIHGRQGVVVDNDTATLINTGSITSDFMVDIKSKEVCNYTDVRAGASVAVIASGQHICIHATDRFLNTSAQVSAAGNADIRAKEIKFLNTEIKKVKETGWYKGKNQSSSSTKIETIRNHTSGLDIGGHLHIEAKDGGITLEGSSIHADSLSLLAQGKIHLVELHDSTTVTTHRSSHSESGFWVKKVHSERHDSKKVDQTSIGVRFNVKEQMHIQANGDVAGSGVVFNVGSINGSISGDCNLKHGTEEHYEEKSDAVSNKKRTFFIFNNDESEATTSKKGAKKAVAEVHNIKGVVALGINGAYDSEGVLFHADQIDIRAIKSNTTALPQETIYDDYTKGTQTYKTGLLGFSYEKGTFGLDLKKETDDFEQVGNTRVHLKKVGYKAKKNISLISQEKKVSSRGIDITSEQGSILLYGKQGVDTSPAVANYTTSRYHSSQTSTGSLSVTNQFAVAGHKIADIARLGKAVQEAKKNYSQFKAAKASAQVALKKGEITKTEYAQLASQEPHHIASITMATAALAAGTGAAAKSGVNALPSVLRLGFSDPGFTTATEYNHTKTNHNGQTVATSAIKAKQAIVVQSSEGSWVACGSNLEADKLTIQTKGGDFSSFQASESSVKSGGSHANSITYGIPTSFSTIKDAAKGILHGTSAAIHGSTTSGQSSATSHHTTHMHANHVHIDVDGDVSLRGGRIDAKVGTGVITGRLDIETPINSAQSRDYTLGGSISGGLVTNGISVGISGNIDRKITDQNQFALQSGILATHHLDLKVDKIITNTGGILAASNGNMQISAQDYIAKDRVAISISNDMALSGTLGGTFSKTKGNKTTITNRSSGSYDYKQGYSADKSRATLGQGTITLKHQRNHLGNRAIEGAFIHLGSSAVKTNIDSTTLKAVITPVQTATDFVKDLTTLKDVTVTTANTIASVSTLGIVGAVAELANNALDAYDANIIGKDKAFVKRLDNVATQSVDATEADATLNDLESRTTTFKTTAEVTAYRGNAPILSDTLAADSNAFYSKSQDKKFVNLTGADIKGADDLFGAIKHEEQRRVNEHNPRLRKLSEAKQQLLTDRRRKRAFGFAQNQGFTHRMIKIDLSTAAQRAAFAGNNALAEGVSREDGKQFAVPLAVGAIKLGLAAWTASQVYKAGKYIINDPKVQESWEKREFENVIRHSAQSLPFIGDAIHGGRALAHGDKKAVFEHLASALFTICGGEVIGKVGTSLFKRVAPKFNNVFSELVGRQFKLPNQGITGVKGGEQLLLEAGKFPRLDYKFGKHAAEWSQYGSISKVAYYNRAMTLANSPVNNNMLGFISKKGWIFRYNTSTGEFLTKHPSGYIETFFIPKRGISYYLGEVEKYAK